SNPASRPPSSGAASPRPAAPPRPRSRPSRPATCAAWSRARSARRPAAGANSPRPMTERARRMRILAAAATAGLLAACGGDPASRADLAAAAQAARQPAELAIGEFTVRASLAPTASLGPGIARHYGVEPGRDVHLLLVGVRRGPVHEETSVPAQVSARARDLRGVWQDVPMHEVRSEDF